MEDDAYILKLLSETPSKVEALSWLTQKDEKWRSIGESSEDMDVETSLQFVENLYAEGASEVLAIDLEVDDWSESTSTLILTLPEDMAKRDALFAIHNEHAEEHGFGPTPDTGQRYLLFYW